MQTQQKGFFFCFFFGLTLLSLINEPDSITDARHSFGCCRHEQRIVTLLCFYL